MQQKLETSHIAYDNMLGADLKKDLKMIWNKTWKEQMINISKCTEAEMMQAGEKQIDPGLGGHTLSKWVAQNIMRT